MSYELSPTHPQENRGGGRELKTQNSKLITPAIFLFACLVLSVGCAHRGVQRPQVRPTPPPAMSPTTPAPAPTPTLPPVGDRAEADWVERGLASWYGEPYHGRRSASGETYDMHRLTAAHRTLEFGSLVRVTRRDSGAAVEVRINDRGPFIEGRIIDLSFAAAKTIGLDIDGVAPVEIRLIGRVDPPARATEPANDSPCYWVQVGAFRDRGNARRAETELERDGETAVVLEGADELWRVRVGPFEEEKLAEKARNRITDAWPGAHVIPCGG
jgi:rare lipoprotein A